MGLSLVACTPFGEQMLATLGQGGGHQFRIAPPRSVSNKELLTLVNEQLGRSMEEMKQFVRHEVGGNQSRSIYISSSRSTSLFESILKTGVILGATYGLLRLSGYPVDDLLFVSKWTMDQMVRPLLEKVDSIRAAAEEGFAVVLNMVQNFRAELKDMQTEVKGKFDKVDGSVIDVQTELNTVTTAMRKLDESLNITNQGMRLIVGVVRETLPNVPAQEGLGGLAADPIAQRDVALLDAPSNKFPILSGRLLAGVKHLSSISTFTDPRTGGREKPKAEPEEHDAQQRITDIIQSNLRLAAPSPAPLASPQ